MFTSSLNSLLCVSNFQVWRGGNRGNGEDQGCVLDDCFFGFDHYGGLGVSWIECEFQCFYILL